MFEFAYIWAFALLPLPLLIFWVFPPLRQRIEALRLPTFGEAIKASGRKASKGAWISKRNFWQWLLLYIIWTLVLTALASPRIVGEPQKKIKTARNFVIAADISFSMANTDWSVDGKKNTRWDGVKYVLKEFIHQRKSDRLALVFFGTNAYLQAPLTTDLNVVEYMLDQTDVGMAGQMTSIGKAIGYSIKIFEGDTLDQKVMLLLTDGQDDGRGMLPIDAAKTAKKDSIKIYTIGIGDPTGKNQGLDETTLRSIAEATGGQYFLAQDPEQLKAAYTTLNELEPIEYEADDNVPITLLYMYPLGAAIILSLLMTFLQAVARLIQSPKKD
ncbi:MAG: VWA domain-containing protein [Mangrovibacterium sp.]